MRVLIDACLPVKLQNHIPLPGIATVRGMGWQRLKNGELLTRAQGQFDVLITMDKSIPAQQYLAQYSIGLVIVRARSNRLADLSPLIPKMLAALSEARPGTAVLIEE
jgi:predicted nuclease of predicted toxin-antitoxin system